MRLLAIALCGLTASACATVVWYGRSPDRRVRAKVVRGWGGYRVYHGGRGGAAYAAVAVASLTFGAGGELAYAARRGGEWVLVRGERAIGPWQGVGEIRFSPDGLRLAFAAERRGRWVVVRDDVADPPVDAVLRGSLRFSADSRRLAYVAQRAGKYFVVIDGRPGPPFAGIAQLRTRGSRFAYVGRRGGRAYPVVDGAVGPGYEEIRELTFRPGSGALAFLARKAGRAFAVLGSTRGPSHHAVAGLRFSLDGRHVAYVAEDGGKAAAMLDARPGPRFDAIRFATVSFTRSGTLLYVARSGDDYHVVFGNVVGPPFDHVEAPVVAGDRWGYLAFGGGAWQMILDGEPDGEGRHDWAGDLVLGPGGGRYAYVARRGKRMAIVHDQGVDVHDVVVPGSLAFDAGGRRWACLVGNKRRRGLSIVIDGYLRLRFDTRELVAAAARRPGQTDLLRKWISAELARHRPGARRRRRERWRAWP